MFLNPNHFSNLNSNCSNLLDMRNIQEQVKKNTFCYQKLFWPFTVWKKCSSDLKNFANSRPSASNFKSFSRSLEQFFLTVGQNNFINKIPFLGSSSSSDCKDDVLQNVKFKDETLTRMQDKKNQLVKRSSLEKKEEHLGIEYFKLIQCSMYNRAQTS